MLHEFLSANRTELVQLCRARVAERRAPKATGPEMEFGIPIFLEQLIRTLSMEQTATPLRSRSISGPAGGSHSVLSEIGSAAARHGHEMQDHGFSVDQVIHDYGDLCQSITQLADERSAEITAQEFQTLNRCLDNAIADAVTGFAHERDLDIAGRAALESGERLGFLVHELRNFVNTAMLAQAAIKAGGVGTAGATSGVLDRSLIGLSHLIDRSIGEVRARAEIPPLHERLSLADFIADVKISTFLEAQSRGLTFHVLPVDPRLAIDVDRDLIFSAVCNLLQNAFKFTQQGSAVTLRTYSAGSHVVIEVADHCGGLPDGLEEKLFRPFSQGSADRRGLGLGLAIAKRSVEAIGGSIGVRDVPGVGCVFRIDLPRHDLGVDSVREPEAAT